MKKILSVFFALCAFVLLTGQSANKAEAARVVVLPLVTDTMQLDEEDRHPKADYGSFYWKNVSDIVKFPAYDLLSDDEVNKALPAEGLKTFDEASFRDIAAKTNADVVIGMRMDRLSSSTPPSGAELMYRISIKGEFVYLNRLTNIYKVNKIYDEDDVDYNLIVRSDWRADRFGKIVRNNLRRALNIKD